MQLVIYCSQATRDFGPDDLVSLLTLARAKNETAGLSGMLLYCGQSFLQVLEGEPETLDVVYARIGADERHENLRLLFEGEVAAPMFPDWTMGFEHLEEEDLADEFVAFTPSTEYPLVNPDLITNAGVAQTLLRLYAKNREA